MVNFPDPILNLPEADIPLKGIKAFLSQGQNHQIIFMEFSEDVDLLEHSHESQWGIVLEGEIELVINGIKNRFKKGERYFIPKGVMHSGKIFAGYAEITFFYQKDRYGIKNEKQLKLKPLHPWPGKMQEWAAGTSENNELLASCRLVMNLGYPALRPKAFRLT